MEDRPRENERTDSGAFYRLIIDIEILLARREIELPVGLHDFFQILEAFDAAIVYDVQLPFFVFIFERHPQCLKAHDVLSVEIQNLQIVLRIHRRSHECPVGRAARRCERRAYVAAQDRFGHILFDRHLKMRHPVRYFSAQSRQRAFLIRFP